MVVCNIVILSSVVLLSLCLCCWCFFSVTFVVFVFLVNDIFSYLLVFSVLTFFMKLVLVLLRAVSVACLLASLILIINTLCFPKWY